MNPLDTRPRPSVAPAPHVPRQGRAGTAVPHEPTSRPPRVDQPARPASRLFGLEVAPFTMAEVLERAARSVETRERLMLGVLNAAKVVNLHRDEVLRTSLLECDLLLADGQSVVWASRLVGHPLPERVAGIDIFESLLAEADRRGHRVYLLGATQEVLDAVLRVVAQRWPGLVVAGSRNGYFDEEQSGEVAEQIRASRADLLFLAMSSPKKENFLGRYGDQLGVPVMHGVGGSFDVMAGVVRRAPEAWQRAGMEWAYRLVQEPGRLWRRYLVTNTTFVWMTLRERYRPLPLFVLPASPSRHEVGSQAAVSHPVAPQLPVRPLAPPVTVVTAAPTVRLPSQRRPSDLPVGAVTGHARSTGHG